MSVQGPLREGRLTVQKEPTAYDGNLGCMHPERAEFERHREAVGSREPENGDAMEIL